MDYGVKTILRAKGEELLDNGYKLEATEATFQNSVTLDGFKTRSDSTL